MASLACTTDSLACAAVSFTLSATFLVLRLATRFGLTLSAIASSVDASSSRVRSISAASAAGSCGGVSAPDRSALGWSMSATR